MMMETCKCWFRDAEGQGMGLICPDRSIVLSAAACKLLYKDGENWKYDREKVFSVLR